MTTIQPTPAAAALTLCLLALPAAAQYAPPGSLMMPFDGGAPPAPASPGYPPAAPALPPTAPGYATPYAPQYTSGPYAPAAQPAARPGAVYAAQGNLPLPATGTPSPSPLPPIDQRAITPRQGGTSAGPPMMQPPALPIGDLNLRQKAITDYCETNKRRPTGGLIKFDGQPWCVYVREFMTTTIEIPPTEEIRNAINGNEIGFEVKNPKNDALPPNMIAVRPNYAGVDTTIHITSSAGVTYLLYVASTPYNADQRPDSLVKIQRAGAVIDRPVGPDSPLPGGASDSGLAPLQPTATPGDAAPRAGRTDAAAPRLLGQERDTRDPAASLTAPVEPRPYAAKQPDPRLGSIRQLRLRYRTEQDKRILPLGAYANDHFTYVEFGTRFHAIDAPVIARVTPDGAEQIVQWRAEGTRLVVTGTGRFILSERGAHVCIDDPEEIR